MATADIETFFAFFRKRVQHAKNLCAPGQAYAPMEPDLHVLISAGLDSLAMYWAKTFSPTLLRGSGGFRMGEFLLRHGDARIFTKCSAPNLLTRATAEGKALRSDIARYLSNEGPAGTVRFWQHDPDLAQVIRDLSRKGADAGWLQRSRYGELLYKEYRCMWVHQFQPSPKLADGYDPDEPEPRYQNKLVPRSDNTIQRVQLLMFSRAFLLKTYETVVEAFANECISSGTAPVID